MVVQSRHPQRAALQRALLPNDNDPADVPPATVGPPDARPGDPNGVELVAGEPAAPRIAFPPPAHWSGWPAQWATSWGMGAAARLEDLSDIAWGCIDLNAALLSTMPPYLVNAVDSLDTSWLANPDPDLYTDWSEFAKQLFWDYQTAEVFVLATAYFATGWPARFHVVAPWLVNVDLDAAGMRRYTIGAADVTDDILHIRYKSRVGDARGHGPLEVGHYRLVAANVLARYGTNFVAAGGVPTSVLTHPAELTAEQIDKLRDQWVEARMANMGLPAVLSGGVTWQPTQVNPADLGLTDLMQLNEARIAVLLRVPPFLMGLPSGGDSMTYSNVNALFDYHWRSGLRPRAAQVMGALSQWLLPRGTSIEVNRDAYVQPDPLERAQMYAIYAGIVDVDGNQAMTLDEIRLAERFDTPTTAAQPGVLKG